MKRVLHQVVLGGCVATLCVASAWAKTPPDEAEEQQLDQEAATPAGTQHVTQRLMQEFGVDEARISSLRDERLGYGEIHHALSLAQQMPGGITDDNINQLLQMWQDQHLGWGQIAQQLDTKLGPVVKQGGQTTQTSTAGTTTAESVVHPGRSASSADHGLNGHQADGLAAQTSGGRGFGHASGSGGGVRQSRGRNSQAPGHTR